MFVRRSRNRSGSTSVKIISKKNGVYKTIQLYGSSNDPDEIERLILQAKQKIHTLCSAKGQEKLFPLETSGDLMIEAFVHNLSNSQIHTVGPEIIFGVLFDRIGFNAVPDELFRHLVITRLAHPVSKLKTMDYLYRYRGIHMTKNTIYRFLDNLSSKHKKLVEDITYKYTKGDLKNISVVFYDMTTLYFEAEDEDDLRKIGFSKDGKFQKPQIMIGLLVGEKGLPISYDIFEGNTFEGHTLLPILEKAQKRYGFGKPIVIADAALLSKKNLEKLGKQKYKFIIGGRIKNESDETKSEILAKARKIKDGGGFSVKKEDGTRLVVTYSDKRAKKDMYNRKRGLRKLRLRVKSGRLTKASINNRGYNKFLVLTGSIDVVIDEGKIRDDKKWDGLKGYITNTKLSSKSISNNYGHLWQIEKAFRISKTDLRIRPIYHRLRNRIEAHICISFVAYTIYKELERLLKKHNVLMSARRAGELTHNMYELEYSLSDKHGALKKLLKMDDEQKLLHNAVHNCG